MFYLDIVAHKLVLLDKQMDDLLIYSLGYLMLWYMLSNRKNRHMVDWEIYPIHKGFLGYPLDEEVALDHLVNLFKYYVNNLSIDLPSWKAKKLKIANIKMNIRKIKQHGISRSIITCLQIFENKFINLYKIDFVQDLVLVLHNEHHCLVKHLSSFFF